ncbi:MAG: threonylcarbamoyl-AMP synthase [Deltaproteobacteria bacterium]|nr:threonylcarbamoyl-AMP synthase [Deltaproteobacteria bacterium]
MRIIIDPSKPKPRIVKKVADVLSSGGIIVYPTDTVYGLGCSISNRKGIEKINTIKKSKKPKSIMLSDLKSISSYAKVSNMAYRVIRSLLPGPYTIVLPATREVPRLLQSRRKSVGIRIPDHWFCTSLVSELGEPVITTTIPLPSGGTHIDPLEIEHELGHLVDVVVDGGILPDLPSTVISVEDDKVEILREGLGKFPLIE